MKSLALLATVLAFGGLAAPATAAEGPCTDCDLVIAERDLPDGYTYDADSPERDPDASARSTQLHDCVMPTKARRERPGVEHQSALFETSDDPVAGDENVIRFKTVKQAHVFAATFDDYLLGGPKCTVIQARGFDGSLFDLAHLEAVDLGEIGDQSAAIVSDSPIEAIPNRYLAIVRTGRTVLAVEAHESEQIDRAGFVQLVEDAVAAASD